ncbi:MAG: MFS transporter [Thermoleophilia bacterium]|nr:MFS transporter [Thermoleophilia bacterium]
MFAIAMSFAVFALGGSALQLGTIMIASMIVLLMTLLPSGALADRFSRKRIAVISDFLRTGCQLAAAILVFTKVDSVWWLLPGSILFGFGTALHQPSTVGFIAEVVPRDKLVKVNSAIQACRGIGLVLGAAIGGFLVDAFGAASVLTVDGFTFLLCAVIFAFLRTHAGHVPSTNTEPVRIRDGFAILRREPWLLSGMLLVSGFIAVMYGPMQIIGPLFAKQSGGGAILWGTISAVIAVGVILGAVATQFGYVKRPLLVVAVLLVFGVSGHLVLASHGSFWLALPGYCALGAAMGSYGAIWEATKQREVSTDMLSRVGSLDWFVSASGMLTGMATATIVASTSGISTMFVIMAVGAVLVATATLLASSLREVVGRTSASHAQLATVVEPVTP